MQDDGPKMAGQGGADTMVDPSWWIQAGGSKMVGPRWWVKAGALRW